ncbi:MAG: FAD-binding oxidoreductase [Leptolyngbyaceae cyanobacterium]
MTVTYGITIMGSIAQTVAALLPASQVISFEELDGRWQRQVRRAIVPDQRPECVVFPQNLEQLTEVVACAHTNRWRLLPCGQGSKLDWGALTNGIDLVISTRELNQIIEHAVGDLTVTAQSGVTFDRIQRLLSKTRQFLALDPAFTELATLGGIIATRNTNALRQRYGGIRDQLIGVTFVRYDGQLAKAGGRVVKNVAGYDLMKLMSGSFGTLGILTELTLRTFPQQEASQTIVLQGSAQTIQQITAAVLLSSLTPVRLDVLSRSHLPQPQQDIGLALQFQSIAAGVAEQIERLQAMTHPYELTWQALTDDADSQFWQALDRRMFDDSQADTAIAQMGILPAQAIDLFEHLRTSLTAETWQARLHASSGMGTLKLDPERTSLQQLTSVRQYCQSAKGYLNLLRAPQDWKDQFSSWQLNRPTQMLMSRLRQQFDPHQLLSPGRMDAAS